MALIKQQSDKAVFNFGHVYICICLLYFKFHLDTCSWQCTHVLWYLEDSFPWLTATLQEKLEWKLRVSVAPFRILPGFKKVAKWITHWSAYFRLSVFCRAVNERYAWHIPSIMSRSHWRILWSLGKFFLDLSTLICTKSLGQWDDSKS